MKEISLIKVLAFPVVMRFNVFRLEDSVENNVSDVTAIIESSMCFGIDCVFARLRSYKVLRPKSHALSAHMRY